jgi:hypothetical protein
MAAPKVRQFAGDFRMWRKENGQLVPVIPDEADPNGNQPVETDAATFSYEAGDETRVVSKRLGARYNQPIYSDVLPGVTSLSLTLLEIPTAIFARILFANLADTSVTAGTAADVEYTVPVSGAPVQLPHRFISSLVVKKGAATLVAGTDYVNNADLLRRGQIQLIAGGDLEPGDEIDVSYSYPAVTSTRFLGGATPSETFYITGDMQDRISGERGELTVYEVKLSVDGDVDWLSAEPISPVLTGELVVPDGAPAAYTFDSYSQAA